jgi:hypothetical protein
MVRAFPLRLRDASWAESEARNSGRFSSGQVATNSHLRFSAWETIQLRLFEGTYLESEP